MTLKLSMLLTADVAQAKGALSSLQGSFNATKGAAHSMGVGSKITGDTLGKFAKNVDLSAKKLDVLKTKQMAVAATSTKLAGAHKTAAGSLGNLTAQFNDIGVMMAAGQNPLTLALQQGTQISQVIGPMGAAGAVQALKSALVGMMNPISLITIGTIAFGAAAVQWLTSASDEAVSFEDQMSNLNDAMSRYADAADLATASTGDLKERFGSAASDIRVTIGLLEQIARAEAQETIDGITQSMARMMNASSAGRSEMLDARRDIASFFDVDIGIAFSQKQKELKAEAQALTSEFKNQQIALGNATGDLGAQIEIMQRLITITQTLAAATDGVSVAERDLLKYLNETLLVMQEQRGMVEEVEAATRSLAIEAYGAYGRSRVIAAEATAEARAMLTELRGQADMHALIRTNGEASMVVAQARAAAERAVQQELVEAMEVSDAMKVELMAAYDAAHDLSVLDMTSGIARATGEAARLVEQFGLSLGLAQQIANIGKNTANGNTITGFENNDPRNPNSNTPIFSNPVTFDSPEYLSKLRRKNRGGGGKSSQVDATARLIEQLQNELAVMREIDPVQKEMLRNRTALAGATEAERTKVEQLIGQRNAEAAAIEQSTARAELFRDATSTALDVLINKGGSLDDVLKAVALSFIDAALQANKLGDAKIGGGGGIGGGLFDAFFGGLFGVQKKAGGGAIYGPGGPTDDKVPVWASNGEFMINAKATARHRPLLEAINAGAGMQQLARGGPVGRAGRTQSAAGAASDQGMIVNMDLRGATGNAEIEAASRRGMEAALQEYDRDVLPLRVQQVRQSPRELG